MIRQVKKPHDDGIGKAHQPRTLDIAFGQVGIITVDLKQISGGKAKAWWYDPRTGKADPVGEFETTGNKDFTPPNEGETQDWVLVLDDATKGFGPPGK